MDSGSIVDHAIQSGTHGMERKRLFLRLGDRVVHRDCRQWGEGIVIEEMTSRLEGGTCLVRIRFRDGKQRTFNNDLDHEMCCYYLGLRRSCEEPENLPHRPSSQRRIR